MDLWIRSQDKMNLCKAHDLVIRENHSGYDETDYVIQDVYTMGTYKTKERALEVLDEIQYKIQRIKDDFYYEDVKRTEKIYYKGYTKQHKDCVYEMPKE